jgi:predicted SprT family Zn-dependent metalloprotease
VPTKPTPHSTLTHCATTWSLPDLPSSVSITFSPRLRATLGRCHPEKGRITLHQSLALEAADHLPLVLCHELAHVVAFRRHGPAVAPHGPEWRALVQQAGFDPAVTLPVAPTCDNASAPGRLAYAHTCPTCHTRRLARRPVPRWRCAECVAAGLPGELVITRTGVAT